MTFEQWMRSVLDRVEDALGHYLPAETAMPAKLHEAMRYAVLGGGKRVRPLLCHAAGELTGATEAARNAAAAALEMIHVYSLVHDDMPCMDDDALRRGKPTVHVQYDEPTALLVGDALQSQAFVALTDAAALSPVQQAALVRELALASGSIGMAGGQAIDLASVGLKLTREQLETMHRMKTGALLRAAVRMGALAGETPSAETMAALDVYAGPWAWPSRSSTTFSTSRPIRRRSARRPARMRRMTSRPMYRSSASRRRASSQRNCAPKRTTR